MVIGADTTPKGFFAPVGGGERKNDPDWLRFHLLGATNPVYFALFARRRMDLYGATAEDFAQVKVKNSRHGLHNPNARFRKENAVEDVLNSPVVADPLRLLDICATSDGAAALIVVEHGVRPNATSASLDGAVRVKAVSHRHADLPAERARTARHRHRLHRSSCRARPRLQGLDRLGGLRGGRASGPRTSAWPRSTTCRPRSSSTGTNTSVCVPKGEAEGLLRSGRDRRSAAASRSTRRGGLACFGEAIPAQAIAQVCELTWQLRGQAGERQVEGATVGITANQGLFGHGSSVIVAR